LAERKKETHIPKPPKTEHLAAGLLESVSKGGLIDWYLYNKGTVPIPGNEHQSILIGTFYSQRGWDGFFSSFYFTFTMIKFPDLLPILISPGLNLDRMPQYTPAHGTKVQTPLDTGHVVFNRD
jgi:hypothetical protein